jgi:transposase
VAFQKRYLAAALDPATGQTYYILGPKKNNALFQKLLVHLQQSFGNRYRRIYVACDNYEIHEAKAVGRWLEEHSRFELAWLPSYCPKANLIERGFGDVHDKCTRNHARRHLRTLGGDVGEHMAENCPWKYRLSEIYYNPEVDLEVDVLCIIATFE